MPVCVCVRVCVLTCLHVGRCKCEVELGGLQGEHSMYVLPVTDEWR